MTRLTPTEAAEQGYAIYTDTYPWWGIKGQFYSIEDVVYVMTDTEAMLFETLKELVAHGPQKDNEAAYDRAIAAINMMRRVDFYENN
jgi:hypothetical protein